MPETAAMSARLRLMRRLAALVIAAGAASTLAFVLAQPASAPLAALPAVAWMTLPYVLLAFGLRFLARTPPRALVLAAAAAAVAIGGLWQLVDASHAERAGAALLLLPVYQCVLALAALLVVSVLHLRRPVPPGGEPG